MPPRAILLTTWYRVPRAMAPENTPAPGRVDDRRATSAGSPFARSSASPEPTTSSFAPGRLG